MRRLDVIFSGLTLLTTTALLPFAAIGQDQALSAIDSGHLTVHKSPTCGCCGKWIDHLKNAGFEVEGANTADIGALKREFKIAPAYRSCHTAVWSQGDYVFEGHIPAKIVAQFLEAPPEDARGLSVPAMPVGSPGMEVGDKFMPYDVLLLKSDGSTSVYTRIESQDAQY